MGHLCCSSRAEPMYPNRSWYHSSRIQRMMEMRGECSTNVEFEVVSSRVHHSEVDPVVSVVSEHSARANREYLDLLRRRRYVREGNQLVAKQIDQCGISCSTEDRSCRSLFGPEGYWDDLVVGEKLAEGGQAEIYAARRENDDRRWVVKVFKAESVLQHLEQQWPPSLLKYCQYDWDEPDTMTPLNITIFGAELLKDKRLLDRFAFVMEWHWGDLRKLIDERMMDQYFSHNQLVGPPFPPHVVLDLMQRIALDMLCLHGQDPPILHKGLKAANILVEGTVERGPYVCSSGCYRTNVADYECSVGVVGTGLWRAPEILRQLKEQVPMEELVFTKKCDVYSFGMTCYELVSGRLPYEDCNFVESHNLILDGKRSQLPPDLHLDIGNIIKRCWHPEA